MKCFQHFSLEIPSTNETQMFFFLKIEMNQIQEFDFTCKIGSLEKCNLAGNKTQKKWPPGGQRITYVIYIKIMLSCLSVNNN